MNNNILIVGHFLVFSCRHFKQFSIKCANSLQSGQCALRTSVVVRNTLKSYSTVISKVCKKSVFASLTACGTPVFGLVAVARLHFNKKVACEEHSRLHDDSAQESSNKEIRFPWNEFFKLLLPDIWYLIGAVMVCYYHCILQ